MTAPAIARRWREPGAVVSVVAAVRDHVRQVRRVAPLGAGLLSALVVHVGVVPHLAVGGAAPDVLLVGVVAVAVRRGAQKGAAFGFAAGLGADLFIATPLGTSALAFTLVGHVLGRSNARPPSGTAGARSTRRQRRTAARRVALRRSAMLSFVGVGAGRLGVAVVATTLAGVPFLDTPGLLQIAAAAAVSAPFGPAVFAAADRLDQNRRGRR